MDGKREVPVGGGEGAGQVDATAAPIAAAASATAAAPASPRGGVRHVGSVRKAVKLVVLLLVVAGLFVGIGWGSYSSMGIDAIAYLCPLGALESLLAAKTAVPRFVIALVIMVVLVALLGRAFCAWVCPVPPIEAFFRPRKKTDAGGKSEVVKVAETASHAAEGVAIIPDTVEVAMLEGSDASAPIDASEPEAGNAEDAFETAEAGAHSPLTAEERLLLAAGCGADAGCGASSVCVSCLAPVGGARDGFRIGTRHGVLLGALASAAVFGFPVFCLICPVGLAVATVVALWQAFVGHAPSWSLLVFPLMLVVELVVFQNWCHALCPMGALMSLLGQRSLFKPHVSEDRCLRAKGVDCRVCVGACPERLDPHATRLPECTKCGACVDACPAHAIAMPAFSKEKEEGRFVLRKGR